MQSNMMDGGDRVSFLSQHWSLLQGQDTASAFFSICPHTAFAELSSWLKAVKKKVRKKIAFLGKIIPGLGTKVADIANVANVANVAR